MSKVIVVPTDFSDYSDRALAQAIELAGALGHEIYLLHVHETPAYWGYDAVVVPQLDTVVSAKIDSLLAERVARVKARGVACTEVRREGKPWPEIVDCARSHDAAYIVMGTHGRTGISHALVGSVAERVAGRAHCPVVVVPPERKAKAKPAASDDDDE